jgi:hypothetical protein
MNNEKKRKISSLTFLTMLIAGFCVIMLAAMELHGYEMISQDKYLTDPSTPYNEMENASFTIPAKDIVAGIDTLYIWMVCGISIIGCGYLSLVGFALVIPSKKKDHIDNCRYGINTDSEVEYCPLCGIRLKDVKE